jgi:hypothetical protein
VQEDYDQDEEFSYGYDYDDDGSGAGDAVMTMSQSPEKTRCADPYGTPASPPRVSASAASMVVEPTDSAQRHGSGRGGNSGHEQQPLTREFLTPLIRELLKGADQDNVTQKGVRQQLTMKLGRDVEPVKKLIKEIVRELIGVGVTQGQEQEEEQQQQHERPSAAPSSSSSSSSSSFSSSSSSASTVPSAPRNKDTELLSRLLKTVDMPIANGWSLYDHQREAAIQCIRARGSRSVLAYDMGLGKTLIGCVVARAFQLECQCKVLVLAPVSLADGWRREAALVGIPRTQMRVASWAKVPTPPSGVSFVLIADEAHYMQSMTSKRTKGALALAQSPGCKGVVLATGTPMKNGRPCNLFPLLCAIRHPLTRSQSAGYSGPQAYAGTAQAKMEYERRYCNAKRTRYCAWDISGASNLSELRARLDDAGSVLRKTKDECLDLPPMTRVMKKVEVPAAAGKEYKQVLATLKAKQQQARGKQSSSGGGSEDVRAMNDALGQLNALRHANSLAKVSGCVEVAEEALEQHSSVVVFTWYKDTAHQLHSLLDPTWGAGLLTGDTKPADRQAMVDEFQKRKAASEGKEKNEEETGGGGGGSSAKGKAKGGVRNGEGGGSAHDEGKLRVLVCTFGAGGVGLTMTAADTVILLDRPWTPGDAAQAEDRIRRIGQEKAVTSVWLQANDLDTKVDAMLQKKQDNVDVVINSNTHGAGGASAGDSGDMGQSTSSMMQTVLCEMLGISAPASGHDNDASLGSGSNGKKQAKGKSKKKARRRSTRLRAVSDDMGVADGDTSIDEDSSLRGLDASTLLSPEVDRQYGSRNRNSRTPVVCT